MFSLMLQKLLHKKWMVLCLLIGNILLISVAVSHPMYRSSSFQKMLTDEFNTYRVENEVWPATFSTVYRKASKNKGIDFKKIDNFMDQAQNAFGIPLVERTKFMMLGEIRIEPEIARDENIARSIRISTLSNINDHITLTAGRMPVDEVVDGYIEVIVCESCTSFLNLLLDEEYSTERFFDPDGNPYKIRIVGFFKVNDPDEPFWSDSTLALTKHGFISERLFNELFTSTPEVQELYSFVYSVCEVWDYTKIKPADAKKIVEITTDLEATEGYGKLVQLNKYEAIIKSYSAKARKVEATLLILQVPAMLLLCAFLYMISGQMLEMEQNEISLMKSRGAKRGQILRLYLGQSVVLGLISLVIAVPFGRVICKILGSASNFLEFSSKRELPFLYTNDIWLYAGGALLIGILMTIIPVIGYSKLSIVNVKQGKHKRKKSLWKAAFFDVICLLVSLYGYYNFHRNETNIMESVMEGESLDPLIYFGSSLFILGAGLLMLRIQPWLVKLVFNIRKKRLRPATYASFLETIRSGRKQEFIMIFMIMTVALGMFNATVARTIVSNAENNVSYINGADLAVREVWRDNSAAVQMDPEIEFKYFEPDFNKYETIDGIDKAVKVINRTSTIYAGGQSLSGKIMAFNASDFVQVSSLRSDLNPYDMYDYLNVMASVENGAIVSSNFLSNLGVTLGSSVTISDPHGGRIMVRVLGFFDYWPTYQPYTYSIGKEGNLQSKDNYLVVTNLMYLENKWGVTPYEVWMSSKDATGLYKYAEENPKVVFTKFNDIEEAKEDIRSDTLFQGTNGILTMSFIIVLVLCAAGYLIYWIMSIRSRELLFGVLRAMGMKKREITTMLVVEQICSGFYSIVAGTLVGRVASILFVPLVQGAYAADNQALPLELVTGTQDMAKLFITILVVVIVCLGVIGKIVNKLNISNALKLGED